MKKKKKYAVIFIHRFCKTLKFIQSANQIGKLDNLFRIIISAKFHWCWENGLRVISKSADAVGMEIIY